MNIVGLFAVALLVLSSQVFAQDEKPEVIVVTGRYPGPPLWKVSNGENVMWIFGTLDSMPKSMEWDSGRVETVLAQAEEYIAQPNKYLLITPQLGLSLLNPFNVLRTKRLWKRLTFNPEGLEVTLGPDLYRRFTVVKRQYFPSNSDIEHEHPSLAWNVMSWAVLQKKGLTPSSTIHQRISKLTAKNRQLVRTASGVGYTLNVADPDLEQRLINWANSAPRDKQVECFSLILERMEEETDVYVRRANAWAKGDLNELRGIRFKVAEEDNPCAASVAASSEGDIFKRSNDDWLAKAERVLDQRHVSFAVLDIGDLLSDQGLLAQLRAKGYRITEPQ